MKYMINTATRKLLNSLTNSEDGQNILIKAYSEAKEMVIKARKTNAVESENIENFIDEYCEDIAGMMAINLEDMLDPENELYDSFREKLVEELGRHALDWEIEYNSLALVYLELTKNEVECLGDEYWPAGLGEQEDGSIVSLALDDTETESTLAFADVVTDPDFQMSSRSEFHEYLIAAVDSLLRSLLEHDCDVEVIDSCFSDAADMSNSSDKYVLSHDFIDWTDIVITSAESYFADWLREKNQNVSEMFDNCHVYPQKFFLQAALNLINYEYVSQAFYEEYWKNILEEIEAEYAVDPAKEK